MERDADLIEQVREIMASAFGVDVSELPEEVRQETYSRWKSLDHVTLMMALEEHFGLTFSMQEMSVMTSLTKIITVLKQHIVTV